MIISWQNFARVLHTTNVYVAEVLDGESETTVGTPRGASDTEKMKL